MFELRNRNVSIGELLGHNSKAIVFCVWSRAKRRTKIWNKKTLLGFITKTVNIGVVGMCIVVEVWCGVDW